MGWFMLFPGASDARPFPLETLRHLLEQRPGADRAGERSPHWLAALPTTEGAGTCAVGERRPDRISGLPYTEPPCLGSEGAMCGERHAYHEAGHAVAMVRLGLPMGDVVCNDTEHAARGGPLPPICEHPRRCSFDLLEKKQDDFSAADARELNWCPPFRQLALKLAVSKAAGPFAEYRWEHRKAPDPPKLNILPNFGGADDRMWVQKCPLGAVAPLEPDDACAYELADRLMKEALARAADVVEREWANIVAVAEALKVKGESSEAAVKSLMRAPHPVT